MWKFHHQQKKKKKKKMAKPTSTLVSFQEHNFATNFAYSLTVTPLSNVKGKQVTVYKDTNNIKMQADGMTLA